MRELQTYRVDAVLRDAKGRALRTMYYAWSGDASDPHDAMALAGVDIRRTAEQDARIVRVSMSAHAPDGTESVGTSFVDELRTVPPDAVAILAALHTQPDTRKSKND